MLQFFFRLVSFVWLCFVNFFVASLCVYVILQIDRKLETLTDNALNQFSNEEILLFECLR